MNKKRLALLLGVLPLAAAVTVSLLAFTGCKTEKEHIHDYTQQVTTENYLKSEAGYHQKAVYYYSCECGEKGTQTFEYGQPKHVFDRQVTEDRYLKSEATLETKAVYYYSCECGERGSQTFEYGEVLPVITELEYEISDNGEFYIVKGLGEATVADIIIPSSVNGKPVKAIAGQAFALCTNLTSVYIPDGVESIGSLAFYNCRGLTALNIPASIKIIENGAFDSCYGLSSITVSENNPTYKSEGNCILSKNGEYLILGCKNSVIPEGVTEIGAGAFNGCVGLESVNIPETVTAIGQWAFAYCEKLTSVSIPCNVGGISDFAFYGCVKLQNVTVAEGVTAIGADAFGRCESLKSAVIPASVTSIGPNAFQGCGKLTEINYGGTQEQWEKIEKGNNWINEKNTEITFDD